MAVRREVSCTNPNGMMPILSALEVFHDYALYKFTIDIDIDIDNFMLVNA